jgi:hypothetical protein
MKNGLWRHSLRIGKRVFARRKYRQITKALCDYVSELVVFRAVDRDNDSWYDERLAACAHLFSLLFSKDGIRFLKNFDLEVEMIKRLPLTSLMMTRAMDHWQKFAQRANQWRKKYYQ